MTVNDFKDGKLIILSKPLDTRSKILNLLYFLLFFISATAFLRLFIFEYVNTAASIVAGIAVIAFYIASYRFVNKALTAEKIFINKLEMHLIRNGLFTSKNEIFDIQKI